jgi:hypothetical protein
MPARRITIKPGEDLDDRQKALAKYLVSGMSYREAFDAAGYETEHPYTSAIIKEPKFLYYVFHLRERMAERTYQSVDLLIKQLDDARLLAMVDRQVSPAIAAIMAKAKLLGYLIDRSEVEMHILNKPSRDPTPVVELSVEEWQNQFGPQRLDRPAED